MSDRQAEELAVAISEMAHEISIDYKVDLEKGTLLKEGVAYGHSSISFEVKNKYYEVKLGYVHIKDLGYLTSVLALERISMDKYIDLRMIKEKVILN
jgi:hypothetical protein